MQVVTDFPAQVDCNRTQLNWNSVARDVEPAHETVNQKDNWHVCLTMMTTTDMSVSAHLLRAVQYSTATNLHYFLIHLTRCHLETQNFDYSLKSNDWGKF